MSLYPPGVQPPPGFEALQWKMYRAVKAREVREEWCDTIHPVLRSLLRGERILHCVTSISISDCGEEHPQIRICYNKKFPPRRKTASGLEPLTYEEVIKGFVDSFDMGLQFELVDQIPVEVPRVWDGVGEGLFEEWRGW